LSTLINHLLGDLYLCADLSALMWLNVAHQSRRPEQTENVAAQMVSLYAARLEDLGPGDFVKVDCAACRHTALLVREPDRVAAPRQARASFLLAAPMLRGAETTL